MQRVPSRNAALAVFVLGINCFSTRAHNSSRANACTSRFAIHVVNTAQAWITPQRLSNFLKLALLDIFWLPLLALSSHFNSDEQRRLELTATVFCKPRFCATSTFGWFCAINGKIAMSTSRRLIVNAEWVPIMFQLLNGIGCQCFRNLVFKSREQLGKYDYGGENWYSSLVALGRVGSHNFSFLDYSHWFPPGLSRQLF